MLNRVYRKARRLIRHRVQEVSTPVGLESQNPVYNQRSSEIGKRRDIKLGKDGNRGTVFLGRWTYHGHQTIFEGFHANDVLSIGAFCSIANHTKFLLCAGHHFPSRISNFPIDVFFHERQTEPHRNYTRIGNDVWIGENAIILPGVHIGNGAVIGAGSVVTRDVDDFSMVGGNPAKHLKWRFEDEQLRKQILETAWWEWPDEMIFARKEFFTLQAEEAVVLAREKGWMRAAGIPASYWEEILQIFPGFSSAALETNLSRFMMQDNTAWLIHTYKSQSYENIALWMAALHHHQPQCIVEFGTNVGCSSLILARLCRYLGLKTRIITINITDELQHPDPDVEYIIEDFTGKMAQIWERWNPDFIFQDAHMYALIKEQLEVGEKYPHTLHFFHDVGFRLYQPTMSIPLDAVPTSSTGSWERHVLGLYAPEILEAATRHVDNERFMMHIFDSCKNPREFGMGMLRFKR